MGIWTRMFGRASAAEIATVAEVVPVATPGLIVPESVSLPWTFRKDTMAVVDGIFAGERAVARPAIERLAQSPELARLLGDFEIGTAPSAERRAVIARQIRELEPSATDSQVIHVECLLRALGASHISGSSKQFWASVLLVDQRLDEVDGQTQDTSHVTRLRRILAGAGQRGDDKTLRQLRKLVTELGAVQLRQVNQQLWDRLQVRAVHLLALMPIPETI